MNPFSGKCVSFDEVCEALKYHQEMQETRDALKVIEMQVEFNKLLSEAFKGTEDEKTFRNNDEPKN